MVVLFCVLRLRRLVCLPVAHIAWSAPGCNGVATTTRGLTPAGVQPAQLFALAAGALSKAHLLAQATLSQYAPNAVMPMHLSLHEVPPPTQPKCPPARRLSHPPARGHESANRVLRKQAHVCWSHRR